MPSSDDAPRGRSDSQRLDKWLWFARIVKTRALAAELVELGKVRVNRTRAAKTSLALRPGDVITVALAGRVRILRVLAAGVRRGPAGEARALYELLSPNAQGEGQGDGDSGKAG